MKSPIDPESDERLATAIRSAFDDILVATETNGHAHRRGSSDGSAELYTSHDGANRGDVAHDPTEPMASGRRRSGRSRWVLSAAAIVILIAGIGALTTFETSETASTPPAGEEASGYRFVEELPPGVVPYLDPAPAQPETIDRPRSFEWVRGITGFSLFAVRDGDGPSVSVVVLETEVPWDVISEGLPTETIGGTAAVVVRAPGETGLFIEDGSAARAVFDAAITDGDEAAPPDVSSEAREVGALVAGQTLDAVTGSNRVVQVTSFGAGPTAVRYGSDAEPAAVLLRAGVPSSMDDNDVQLVAELVSEMSLGGISESLAYERVSPTDLIVVVAADQELADAALAAIQFDERPSASPVDEVLRYDQVIARGEPSWGRWELAARSTDLACWNAAVTIWGPGLTGDEAGECRDAGATGSIPSAFCLHLDDRIVGASLDSDAVFDFQNQSDPDGFEASVEQTGDTVSFQVRDVSDPAVRPEVEITVGKTPLACSI